MAFSVLRRCYILTSSTMFPPYILYAIWLLLNCDNLGFIWRWFYAVCGLRRYKAILLAHCRVYCMQTWLAKYRFANLETPSTTPSPSMHWKALYCLLYCPVRVDFALDLKKGRRDGRGEGIQYLGRNLHFMLSSHGAILPPLSWYSFLIRIFLLEFLLSM